MRRAKPTEGPTTSPKTTSQKPYQLSRPTQTTPPRSQLRSTGARAGDVAKTARYLFLTLSSAVIPGAAAQDLVAKNCTFNDGLAKPGASFDFNSWLRRGLCVRGNLNYDQCRVNLQAVLLGLEPIHNVEYSASASVLALLPTFGALFGAPTSEIWTLLTILPCGGSLAMLLSFGGAIMPSRLSDYQVGSSKDSIMIGQSKDALFEEDDEDQGQFEARVQRERLAYLSRRIQSRISQPEGSGIPRGIVAIGLGAMLLLFFGAHVAMGLIENGAVYSNGCTYNWWFHIWYIAVTLVTILDNWAQVPFRNHHKLYLTEIPYSVEVSGGESVIKEKSVDGEPQNPSNFRNDQLIKVKAGILRVFGSTLTTRQRNTVVVLISVAPQHQTFLESFFPIFTKAASVTVFVFGTCVLSAVSLLAMPMAQLVTMLVATAGIGSRGISTGIVASIKKNEPLIHVITENDREAVSTLSEVFELQQRSGTRFQMELQGHIFVEGKRVARRSVWIRRILGVMAQPYDLRKAENYESHVAGNDVHSSMRSGNKSEIYKGVSPVRGPGSEMEMNSMLARPYTGT